MASCYATDILKCSLKRHCEVDYSLVNGAFGTEPSHPLDVKRQVY